MSARVLLVEDDPDLRGLLTEQLARSGFEVTATGQPDEVPVLLAFQRFDALVCDQRLGRGVTGLMLLEAARAEGRLDETACVLLTGLPPKEPPPWLSVVQKPCDLEVLVGRLKTLAERKGGTPPEPQQNRPSGPTTQPPPVPSSTSGGPRSRPIDPAGSMHALKAELLASEGEEALRARFTRELSDRQLRLSRTEVALRLGRLAKQTGNALREHVFEPMVIAPESTGEADAALDRLQQEADRQRAELEQLARLVARLNVVH